MHDTARALFVVALLGAAGLILPAPAAGQPNGWAAQSTWVGGSRLDSLAVIDMATGRTARFPAPPGILVGPGELTPDGRYFLLSTSVGLARFHTAPPALDRIIGPSLPISAIAVAPTGTTVHVTGAFGRGTLDWESGETLSAQCCAAPLISFTPDGSVRFEVQPGPESTLTAIAEPAGGILWSLVVPGRASRAALSGSSAAVQVFRTLDDISTIVFDLTDGTERGRLPRSEGLAWEGSNLILSHVIVDPERIGRLSSFDEDTLTETVVLEMPAPLRRLLPSAVFVSADRRHVYWLWGRACRGRSTG